MVKLDQLDFRPDPNLSVHRWARNGALPNVGGREVEWSILARMTPKRIILVSAATVSWITLSAASVACRSRAHDPYWTKLTALDLEFWDVALSTEPEAARAKAQRIERLQRLRREIAILDHPQYADKFHVLEVSSLEEWLLYEREMETYADLERVSRDANLPFEKGLELQTALRKVGDSAASKRKEAGAERKRILGQPDS